jgi:hypothetical protein
MYLAVTLQQLGGMAWNLLMAAGGLALAISGPKYLNLIDKGFPEKSRSNPAAAAKQVKAYRIIGALLALCGLALVFLKLSGVGK